MSGIRFKDRIKNFLLNMDIFGVEPKLNMQHSDKHNSTIGGFVSLAFLTTTILGILYFGQELVYKKEPSVIQKTAYDDNLERYNLTLDKFNFFVGISDGKDYFNDPSVYKIDAELAHYYRNSSDAEYSLTTTALKTESCQLQKHFFNFNDLYANNTLLPNFQCLNNDEFTNLYLQSHVGESEYALIRLKVIACANSTASSKCQSKDLIEQRLRDSYVYINFIDTVFNPKDFNTPQSYINRDITTKSSDKYLKQLSITFSNIDYITDSGILIESLLYNTHLKFDNSNELLYVRDEQAPYFIVEFKLSNIRYSIFRKYLKIQKFLSEIGGLIKGLMSILQMALILFSKTSYFTYLINDIYVYTEKAPHEIEEKSMNPLKNKTIVENNFVGPTGRLTYIANNIESIKKFQKMKKKINLTWCEYLKTSIFGKCCKFTTSGVKFLKIGKEKIRSNMSIVRIIKLCDEFELLKDVIFDFNGRLLLNYISENKRLQKARILNNEIDAGDVLLSYGCLTDSTLNNNLKLMFDLNFEMGL
jgi:hypothetical protein